MLDTSNIETKMVYVTSRDGAKVPMFVSTKRHQTRRQQPDRDLRLRWFQHRYQGWLPRHVRHPGQPRRSGHNPVCAAATSWKRWHEGGVCSVTSRMCLTISTPVPNG